MSCRFYYFYCGDYHCGKCDKDVTSDWYYKYCRDYSYDDCPIYRDMISEPAGESSACFLTSACVNAKGLPDNCYELQTLRDYRDKWLAKTQDGSDAIRRYYAMAPRIVDAIDLRDDKLRIYDSLYNHLVLPCVKCIEQKKYEEAFDLYKSITLELEAMYC